MHELSAELYVSRLVVFSLRILMTSVSNPDDVNMYISLSSATRVSELLRRERLFHMLSQANCMSI
jgi:hypothetical protein